MSFPSRTTSLQSYNMLLFRNAIHPEFFPICGRRRITHGAGYEQTSVDAADFVAAIDFDDLAGLEAYLRHPAHQELGARFGQSLSAALVYDFEMGGVEELSGLGR